jgi:predicted PurR-regulated permease PerM
MMGFNAQAARIAWTVFAVALLIYAAYLIRQTMFIFILAILLAYMVYPLVVAIERHAPRRVPRTVTVILVFLALIGLVAGAVAIIGPQIAEDAARLGEQIPHLTSAPDLASRIPLPSWLERFRPSLLGWLQQYVLPSAAETLPLIKKLGGNVLHWVGNIVFVVLVPILSFMLLKDAPSIRARFNELTKNSKRQTAWRKAIADTDVLLAQYIRALLFLSLATFVAYSIAFALLGVEYALLLAAIAAIMGFVPLFGPLLAAGITVLVAALTGFDSIPWLIVFIIGYRIFQDYVLNPYLMSEGIEVHPLLVIFGLLAGEQLAGVAGMFLSIPAIALGRIVIRRFVTTAVP